MDEKLVRVIAGDGVNTADDTSDGFFTISSFTLDAITPGQIVPRGCKAHYDVNITSYGRFNNPVTLNAISSTTENLIFRWVNGSTVTPPPDGFITSTLEIEVPN
jgi:hypothetical protein